MSDDIFSKMPDSFFQEAAVLLLETKITLPDRSKSLLNKLINKNTGCLVLCLQEIWLNKYKNNPGELQYKQFAFTYSILKKFTNVPVITWNDAPGRKLEDKLDLLDKCLKFIKEHRNILNKK